MKTGEFITFMRRAGYANYIDQKKDGGVYACLSTEDLLELMSRCIPGLTVDRDTDGTWYLFPDNKVDKLTEYKSEIRRLREKLKRRDKALAKVTKESTDTWLAWRVTTRENEKVREQAKLIAFRCEQLMGLISEAMNGSGGKS